MNLDLSRLWERIVRVFKILNVSAISIVTVFLSGVFLFKVGQVTDAIIALGDFGSLHHFIILILVGSLWAFFVWYWARVFYYIEYEKRTDLEDYEKIIVQYTPRILGTLALLIIGIAFLLQSPKCQTDHELNPLRIIGIVFIILAIMFIVLVNLRRKIFKLKPLGELHESLEPGKKVVPVINLPDTTRKVLIITTILVSILLILVTIAPIQTTVYMGDGVTVLMMCFCIWLPLLYWVRYFSLKMGFPLYLVITVLIISFSFFNSNKNIRLLSNTTKTDVNIGDYTDSWLQKVKNLNNKDGQSDSRTPMIIVLSEGGGIRAAYWSAQFLARTQRDYPNFRDYLFCISGVSGGSFGATVFDGVLNYYDLHPQELAEKNVIQRKITDIIGKDYLSPTIACLGTREIIQLLIPFPIQSFDRAKVFEETWEYTWERNLNNDSTFSKSFLSLWDNKAIPPVFLNTTQVETGYPVVLSNIRLNAGLTPKDLNNLANQSDFHLPRDFYTDIMDKPSIDVPLSTASLLSARFPFVSPAGTIMDKNGGIISLVDGGYFDNTGANTAYQVLFNIKKIYEKKGRSVYRTDIKPVIVYLTNGIHIPDKIDSSKTMLGQLYAPIETSMQIRDSNTKNNLLKLMEFVNFYEGEFITYSLPKPGDKQTDIPLGWALSSKTQKEIDDRVQEIDIKELGKYVSRGHVH